MWQIIVPLLLPTSIFIWYLFRKWNEKSKPNYWIQRGFLSLSELSILDLVTGKKSMRGLDLENYAKIGDEKCGGISEFGNNLLYIKDLDLARDIFIKDFDHFHDHRDFPKSEPIFEQTLFQLKGQEWKNMRAFLTPTFTSGKIRRMFSHFERTSTSLKKFILAQTKSKNGYSVPIAEAMRKYSIEVIGSAAFGLNINVFENEDQTFFKMAVDIFGKNNFLQLIKLVIWINFPTFSKIFRISIIDPKVSKYFQNMLTASLRAREESYKRGEKGNNDFMQLLVEARFGDSNEDKDNNLKQSGNKNDIQWTDLLMLNQAFAFLSAGFDTVSNNLAIAAYMLAKHPEIQERLFQEVQDLGEITYESVNKMEYFDMFISENLRLHPPVNRIDRKCVKDYPIPGTKLIIPKGSYLAFIAEAIHRDEKHFPNPLEFRPERFSQEEKTKTKRHSYAYMPFGIGNRSCIGNRFALVETKAALANIVKHFEISLPVEMEQKEWTEADAIGYKIKPGLDLHFKIRN